MPDNTVSIKIEAKDLTTDVFENFRKSLQLISTEVMHVRDLSQQAELPLKALKTSVSGLSRSSGTLAKNLGTATTALNNFQQGANASAQSLQVVAQRAASATEIQALTDAIKESTSATTKANKQFVRVATNLEKLNVKMSKTSTTVKKASNNTNQYSDDLRGFARRIRDVNTVLGGMSIALAGAATAGTLLIRQNILAAVSMERLKLGLQSVAGSAAEAERQMRRLFIVAKAPGLGLQEALQGSINLQTVGLSAERSARFLEEMGNALAAVGRGKDDLYGALLGLRQIISSGKVLQEELRQISDRVPQVSKILKDAFGTIRSEELQKKGISVSRFLNVLMNGLTELPRINDTAANSIENFEDSLFRAQAALGETFIPALKSTLDTLGVFFEGLEQLSPSVRAAMGYFGVFAVAILGIGAAFTGVIVLSERFTKAVGTAIEITKLFIKQQTVQNVWRAVTNQWVLITAAIGLAIYAIKRYVDAQREAARAVNVLKKATDDLREAEENVLRISERRMEIVEAQYERAAQIADERLKQLDEEIEKQKELIEVEDDKAKRTADILSGRSEVDAGRSFFEGMGEPNRISSTELFDLVSEYQDDLDGLRAEILARLRERGGVRDATQALQELQNSQKELLAQRIPTLGESESLFNRITTLYEGITDKSQKSSSEIRSLGKNLLDLMVERREGITQLVEDLRVYRHLIKEGFIDAEKFPSPLLKLLDEEEASKFVGLMNQLGSIEAITPNMMSSITQNADWFGQQRGASQRTLDTTEDESEIARIKEQRKELSELEDIFLKISKASKESELEGVDALISALSRKLDLNSVYFNKLVEFRQLYNRRLKGLREQEAFIEKEATERAIVESQDYFQEQILTPLERELMIAIELPDSRDSQALESTIDSYREKLIDLRNKITDLKKAGKKAYDLPEDALQQLDTVFSKIQDIANAKENEEKALKAYESLFNDIAKAIINIRKDITNSTQRIRDADNQEELDKERKKNAELFEMQKAQYIKLAYLKESLKGSKLSPEKLAEAFEDLDPEALAVINAKPLEGASDAFSASVQKMADDVSKSIQSSDFNDEIKKWEEALQSLGVGITFSVSQLSRYATEIDKFQKVEVPKLFPDIDDEDRNKLAAMIEDFEKAIIIAEQLKAEEDLEGFWTKIQLHDTGQIELSANELETLLKRLRTSISKSPEAFETDYAKTNIEDLEAAIQAYIEAAKAKEELEKAEEEHTRNVERFSKFRAKAIFDSNKSSSLSSIKSIQERIDWYRIEHAEFLKTLDANGKAYGEYLDEIDPRKNLGKILDASQGDIREKLNAISVPTSDEGVIKARQQAEKIVSQFIETFDEFKQYIVNYDEFIDSLRQVAHKKLLQDEEKMYEERLKVLVKKQLDAIQTLTDSVANNFASVPVKLITSGFERREEINDLEEDLEDLESSYAKSKKRILADEFKSIESRNRQLIALESRTAERRLEIEENLADARESIWSRTAKSFLKSMGNLVADEAQKILAKSIVNIAGSHLNKGILALQESFSGSKVGGLLGFDTTPSEEAKEQGLEVDLNPPSELDLVMQGLDETAEKLAKLGEVNTEKAVEAIIKSTEASEQVKIAAVETMNSAKELSASSKKLASDSEVAKNHMIEAATAVKNSASQKVTSTSETGETTTDTISLTAPEVYSEAYTSQAGEMKVTPDSVDKSVIEQTKGAEEDAWLGFSQPILKPKVQTLSPEEVPRVRPKLADIPEPIPPIANIPQPKPAQPIYTPEPEPITLPDVPSATPVGEPVYASGMRTQVSPFSYDEILSHIGQQEGGKGTDIVEEGNEGDYSYRGMTQGTWKDFMKSRERTGATEQFPTDVVDVRGHEREDTQYKEFYEWYLKDRAKIEKIPEELQLMYGDYFTQSGDYAAKDLQSVAQEQGFYEGTPSLRWDDESLASIDKMVDETSNLSGIMEDYGKKRHSFVDKQDLSSEKSLLARVDRATDKSLEQIEELPYKIRDIEMPDVRDTAQPLIDLPELKTSDEPFVDTTLTPQEPPSLTPLLPEFAKLGQEQAEPILEANRESLSAAIKTADAAIATINASNSTISAANLDKEAAASTKDASGAILSSSKELSVATQEFKSAMEVFKASIQSQSTGVEEVIDTALENVDGATDITSIAKEAAGATDVASELTSEASKVMSDIVKNAAIKGGLSAGVSAFSRQAASEEGLDEPKDFVKPIIETGIGAAISGLLASGSVGGALGLSGSLASIIGTGGAAAIPLLAAPLLAGLFGKIFHDPVHDRKLVERGKLEAGRLKVDNLSASNTLGRAQAYDMVNAFGQGFSSQVGRDSKGSDLPSEKGGGEVIVKVDIKPIFSGDLIKFVQRGNTVMQRRGITTREAGRV